MGWSDVFRLGVLVSVIAVAATACGGDGAAAPETSPPTPPQASHAPAMPADLRAAYVAAVQADAAAAYPIEQLSPGHLRATGAAARFTADLDEAGVHVATVGAKAPLRATVALAALGCEGAMTPLAPASPDAEGNRATYPRDGVEEWYVNGPLGLEQGFTLAAPPACRREGAGELALDVTLHAEGARLVAVGDGVELRDDAGVARLRYAELFAHDAKGRALPARMALDGERIALRVDDRGAAYPVVVDPLITVQQARLIPLEDTLGTGGIFDNFGRTAAIDGDTAVVGNVYDDRGINTTDSGSAQVFVRTLGVWRPQAKLLPLFNGSGLADDHFGSAVAIDGDTIVVSAPAEKFPLHSGAVYVFVRSGTTWTQQARLVEDVQIANASLGGSVAVSGDTLVATGGGTAKVYTRSGTVWTKQASLVGVDPVVGSGGVNAVALDGDTLLLGAPFLDPSGLQNAGGAFVFVRAAGVWSQQAELLAADGAASDFFGVTVAVSGDTAIAGSPFKDVAGNADQGAAYVFVRSGGVWSVQAEITAADGAVGDSFAGGVSLDGDTAVAGAFHADTAGGANAGAAYVLVRNGGVWSQQAKLTAPDGAADDVFSSSLSIAGDTILLGAPSNDTIAQGVDAGSVYVFDRVGALWSPTTTLYDPTSTAANDKVGDAVALDGDTALIGAPDDATNEGGALGGSAFVFVRANGTWTQQAKLIPGDASLNQRFGDAVALSGDTALVSASTGAGGVYVFVRSGSTWTQQAKILVMSPVAAEAFGASIALSGDTALIGAAWEDDSSPFLPLGGVDAGAAYVFVRNAGVWSQQARLTPSAVHPMDHFGHAVALDADTAVVGAPFSKDNVSDGKGAAFVFVRNGGAWSQQAQLLSGNNFDSFGTTVTVSGDTLAVADSFDPQHTTVSVFVRNGAAWSKQATLMSPNQVDIFQNYGSSLSLDGGLLMVGAPWDNVINNKVGTAYVYERNGAVWGLRNTLTASDVLAGNRYGFAVAIQGTTALAGAPAANKIGAIQTGAGYLTVFTQGQLGDPCVPGQSQCVVGQCYDGVCCDTFCGGGLPGDCMACSIAAGGPINGVCSVVANGTPCDDFNHCTQPDSCQAGVCTTFPKVCTVLDSCHTLGVCDVLTGLCSTPEKPDGALCDDGNACTIGDHCGGNHACIPGAAADCGVPDTCHLPGVCDPATGLCSNPPKADGTSCNDGNACTTMDTCVSGVCQGSSSVVCPAPSACHDPGVCIPATGVCSTPASPDGTGCDDGDACTLSDACQAGACMGAKVTCVAQDLCHLAGACDPASGVCTTPSKPDGAACAGGMCVGGVCEVADAGTSGSGGAGGSGGTTTTGAGGGTTTTGAGGASSTTTTSTTTTTSGSTTTTGAGGASSTTTTTTSGAGTTGSGGGTTGESGGCGCRIASDDEGDARGMVGIALALAIAARRRRRGARAGQSTTAS